MVSSSRAHRCEPRKPAPPVTRTRLFTAVLPAAALATRFLLGANAALGTLNRQDDEWDCSLGAAQKECHQKRGTYGVLTKSLFRSHCLALLRAMHEVQCMQLVFSSTGAVYGNASREPIREGSACEPVNPYGSSKRMIEQILSDYRKAYRLSLVCFRSFNACGADPSGLIGDLRDPETHLIPWAMMALQGYVADFAVFGDDYEHPRLLNTR